MQINTENWTKEDFAIASVCLCQLGWCSSDSQSIAQKLEVKFTDLEIKDFYEKLKLIRDKNGITEARKFYATHTNTTNQESYR